jgi:hypothetical protein
MPILGKLTTDTFRMARVYDLEIIETQDKLKKRFRNKKTAYRLRPRFAIVRERLQARSVEF